MKTTTTKAALLAALSNVAPFADSGAFLSIAKTIRIVVYSHGVIKLTATDVQSWCDDSVLGCRDVESGDVCVDAPSFLAAVKSLDDGDVTISHDWPKHLVIEGQHGGVFKLSPVATDDFPDTSGVGDSPSYTEVDPQLFDAVSRALAAVPQKDPRQALGGVHMKLADGRVVIEGADGKRLVRTSVPCDNPGDAGFDFILPRRVAEKLVKMAADVAVGLYVGERGVRFCIGETVVTSNVIAGQFPNIDMVIPKEYELRWEVDTRELMRNIARSLIVADSEGTVDLTFEDGGCVGVASTGAEVGQFNTAIPAIRTHGDGFGTVRFNAAYIRPMLAMCGETVTICGNAPARPFVFKSESRGDDVILVMPIKILSEAKRPVAA